jgi:hypothetical protein
VFTYYLRDGHTSQEAERKERAQAVAEGQDVPFPGWDALEGEMREQGPTVQVVIRDAAGTVVDRVDGPAAAGVHRVSWDLEYAPQGLVELERPAGSGFGGGGFGGGGYLALPGTYTATLIVTEEGQTTELAGPIQFEVVPLREGALPRMSNEAVAAFRAEVVAFERDLEQAENLLDEQIQKVEALQRAHARAERPDPALASRLYEARLELLQIRESLEGSEAKDEIGERDPPTPGNRLNVGENGLETTYGPTELHRRTVDAGRNELATIRQRIDRLAQQVVPELQRAVETTGAPPVEGG